MPSTAAGSAADSGAGWPPAPRCWLVGRMPDGGCAGGVGPLPATAADAILPRPSSRPACAAKTPGTAELTALLACERAVVVP
jgi:hypothetical protein